LWPASTASTSARERAEQYSAVTCDECGLVFAFPVPELPLDALQKVYGDDYTAGQRKISRSEHAIGALRDATNRQMDLVERYVTRGAALNVGSMSSAIKVLEERGWTLRIVDASRQAAETARNLWGFDVVVSRIEDFECAPGAFDLCALGASGAGCRANHGKSRCAQKARIACRARRRTRRSSRPAGGRSSGCTERISAEVLNTFRTAFIGAFPIVPAGHA
jgi:hypothetical protein